jgi:hypothetical protein
MAYQNCGTPRFYVDIYSYLRAMGLTGVEDSRLAEDDPNYDPNGLLLKEGDALYSCGLNPTNEGRWTTPSGTWDDTYQGGFSYYLLNPMSQDITRNATHNKTVYGFLGHNFKSTYQEPRVRLMDDAADVEAFGQGTEIVNWIQDGVPEHDGFSLYETEHGISSGEFNRFQLRLWNTQDNNTGTAVKLGSIFIGTYYDMPHSPDLSLKLSYEYDGIKTQQTKGGSTLSNAMYTKAPNWGDYGAWQLGDVSSFRSGRRVWNLSFSYLSDTDVFPVNANTSYNATIGSETGYGDNAPSSDTDGNYVFDSNILTGTDFFSQVWNRTMGGHLPFIFNPNGGGTSPNNNPDQFAIARFDMDSLQYDQVAHNTYNVRLKIREVW